MWCHRKTLTHLLTYGMNMPTSLHQCLQHLNRFYNIMTTFTKCISLSGFPIPPPLASVKVLPWTQSRFKWHTKMAKTTCKMHNFFSEQQKKPVTHYWIVELWLKISQKHVGNIFWRLLAFSTKLRVANTNMNRKPEPKVVFASWRKIKNLGFLGPIFPLLWAMRGQYFRP